MSLDEHEIVPRVRDWLSATSGIQVPVGISCEDARREARQLLNLLSEGTVDPRSIEINGDTSDILWAVVRELGEQLPGPARFRGCDCTYRFVSALPAEEDNFGEKGAILHSLARLGWKSAQEGLEATLRSRAAMWEHGEEQRHRRICKVVEQLPARIATLRRQPGPGIDEFQDVTACLVKLASIFPAKVLPLAVSFVSLLEEHLGFAGSLDEHEYLKAAAHLVVGMASRQLGRWDSAESGYRKASLCFERTCDRSHLDRVIVERMALQSVRWENVSVAESAPSQIRRLRIPRERLRARLILAHSLINSGQPERAVEILMTSRLDSTIATEPALEAWLHTMLGTAMSYMGDDDEALSQFARAGAILSRSFHPLQMASLTASVGEHLAKLGRPREAIASYGAASEVYQEVGQVHQTAYLTVLRAELLMLTGRNQEAESALLDILPLIEEFNLRKEAAAAVALLREAVAKRQAGLTSIQSLRDHLRSLWQV